MGECRGRFGRVVKLIGGVGVRDWVFVEVGTGRVIEFSGYTAKQYSYLDDEQFPYIDQHRSPYPHLQVQVNHWIDTWPGTQLDLNYTLREQI